MLIVCKQLLWFKASLFIELTDSKICIVFVRVRLVKIYGCDYNQNSLLKIMILILLRLARFENLETSPNAVMEFEETAFNY